MEIVANAVETVLLITVNSLGHKCMEERRMAEAVEKHMKSMSCSTEMPNYASILSP